MWTSLWLGPRRNERARGNEAQDPSSQRRQVLEGGCSPYAIAECRFKRVDVNDNPSSIALERIIQSAGMPVTKAPAPSVFRSRVVDASSFQRLDICHRNQEVCHGLSSIFALEEGWTLPSRERPDFCER